MRFTHDGRTRAGVQQGDEVVDVLAADPELPDDVVALLDPVRRTGLEAAVAVAPRLALDVVRLENPIPRPRTVFAIGLNYADHAAETGQELPDFPVVFNKQVNCVAGPFDPILLPPESTMLDYEAELAFVVGARCRRVPEGEGLDQIGGYFVMNDVSARDWQFRSPTWTMGKSFDTHGPLGPCVVTADEVGDPHRLGIRCYVNGELRQSSNTDQLVFGCGRLVEFLSTVCTLAPGDIVSTGTPAGVAIGMDPPRFLQPGDVVRCEIDGLGAIENEVVPEPTP